ncbi:hypothetical protein [uncultured Tateyamaria sp.]|uniref:hypothetical protein n=1 Tax=uncultured Tateyamaria sp. TaxID=455651 RepID=UPI00261D36E2|nr:hypothetical protein [uncultured Tateyamaria sp.]
MLDHTDSEIAASNATTKKQRDFDDLQNEISGADTGRMRKFLSPDDDRTPEGKRRKAERDRTNRTLEELMRDPEYAALYTEFGDRLITAERDADTALAKIERQLETAQQVVSDLEARAARDPSGKQVFQYADGRVVYADGSDVELDIAEGIVWPDTAPSAEDYFAAKSRVQSLQDQYAEWDVYRHDVLGDMRNRYGDDDAPMSMDDLKRDLDRIERLNPANVSLAQDTKAIDAPAVETAAAIAVPMALK